MNDEGESTFKMPGVIPECVPFTETLLEILKDTGQVCPITKWEIHNVVAETWIEIPKGCPDYAGLIRLAKEHGGDSWRATSQCR